MRTLILLLAAAAAYGQPIPAPLPKACTATVTKSCTPQVNSSGSYVPAGAGGGATIPSTTNLIKGDGSGNGANSKVAITSPATAATIQFSADNETVVLPAGTLVPNSRTVNGHALSGNVTVTASDVSLGNVVNLGTTVIAQKFFGTVAPGSVATNLPGDFYSDTTHHLDYFCGVASGTAAPACTSVTLGGWMALAPLDSPGLTGTPNAPTADPFSDNGQIANTKYVDDAITAIPAVLHPITFTFDGGGSAITTGACGQFPTSEFAGTIFKTDISSDQSGSFTLDIWKKATAIPGSGDKISASAPVTLSSAQLNQGGSISGWTTSVTAGDVFGCTIATAATVTKVTVQIWMH